MNRHARRSLNMNTERYLANYGLGRRLILYKTRAYGKLVK